MTDANARFAGSIPAVYHQHLGPLFFEPYAEDLASRLTSRGSAPGRVLEVAAGTGILTRHLRQRLPADTAIVATDLNEPMLEMAKNWVGAAANIEWRQADATALPFDREAFDTVICQFGWMFFPDKDLAAREMHRVLRPGGRLLFSVWDSLDENPTAQVSHTTIESFFASDPPTFYQVPFGFSDTGAIRRVLEGAGFSAIAVEPVPLQGVSQSAEHAAIGLVRGNPGIIAIEERATAPADTIVQAVAVELARRFGDRPMRVPMQAIVISATRA